MSAVWTWFKNLDSAQRAEVIRRLKICVGDLQVRVGGSPGLLRDMIQAFKTDEEALRPKPEAPPGSWNPSGSDVVIIDNDGEF